MSKLIAKQHLLPSVRWLFDQAESQGKFSKIDLLIKDYSEIAPVCKQLPPFVTLRRTLEACIADTADTELIILDEGGSLHRELPLTYARRSAGIEQTTNGLQQSWKYPVVLVCRSAAKLFFESQIIARGITRKLESIGLLVNRRYGILGLGALGSALARCLMAKGIPTVGSDIRAIPGDLKAIACGVPELLRRSDVILGCTGVDALAGIEVRSLSGEKIFASCSSADIEFRTLLGQASGSERFGTVKGACGKMNCIILNGGFPINFDRVKEWELFDEIILTRRLVLAGLLQSKALIGTRPRGVMLDPASQHQIVLEWLDQVSDRKSIQIPDLLTERFFRDNSEGDILIGEKPHYTLHSTTPEALAKMRSHKEPYDADIMGLPILVLPGVWSPAHDWSGLFHVENLPTLKGLDFLELGCGTGVISVFAARAGAKRVVAVDVNPAAVRNTRLNFERFSCAVGEAFQSEGLSNVRGKFDLIVWNAPYHGSRPTDMLERGCADEGYHDIRGFFQQAQAYLNPGGKVMLGFSESGDLPLLEALIVENGFRINRKLSDWRQDYNCLIFELIKTTRVI